MAAIFFPVFTILHSKMVFQPAGSGDPIHSTDSKGDGFFFFLLLDWKI